MKSISKSEIAIIIIGEWKSEIEEMIYVFSDSPSFLKKDAFDLLVSNIKLNEYFLTMYCIISENENIFIEIGEEKFSLKYFANQSENGELHLEDRDHGIVVLKKL